MKAVLAEVGAALRRKPPVEHAPEVPRLLHLEGQVGECQQSVGGLLQASRARGSNASHPAVQRSGAAPSTAAGSCTCMRAARCRRLRCAPGGPCRPGPVSHSDDLNLDGRITIDRAGQSSLQCCPRVWACSGGVDLVPAAAGEPAVAGRGGSAGLQAWCWRRKVPSELGTRRRGTAGSAHELAAPQECVAEGPVRGVDRSRRHRGRHSPSFGPPPRQHRSLPASPSALACCTCPSFSCNLESRPGLGWILWPAASGRDTSTPAGAHASGQNPGFSRLHQVPSRTRQRL